jgi:hypothetical protein
VFIVALLVYYTYHVIALIIIEYVLIGFQSLNDDDNDEAEETVWPYE